MLPSPPRWAGHQGGWLGQPLRPSLSRVTSSVGCDQVPSPASSSLPVILFWEFPEALQRTNSGQHTPQKPVRV